MAFSPSISVVVPVYNVEAWLEQCLESILNQTFTDLEILCVDDGSTDGSGDILDAFAARDERVKVVHKPNGGYGKAVNAGMDLACGEYLAIVEPDDFLDNCMYEKLYAAAKESGCDVVKCNFFWYWSEDNCTPANAENKLFAHEGWRVVGQEDEKKLFTAHASIWAGLYRLSRLRELGIRFLETPGASYQDAGFYMKAYALMQPIGLLADALYFYRQSNPSSSTNNWSKKIWCHFEEMEDVWKFLPKLREDSRLMSLFLLVSLQFFRASMYYAPRSRVWSVLRRASRDFRMWTSLASYDESVFNPEEMKRIRALRRSAPMCLLQEAGNRLGSLLRARR